MDVNVYYNNQNSLFKLRRIKMEENWVLINPQFFGHNLKAMFELSKDGKLSVKTPQASKLMYNVIVFHIERVVKKWSHRDYSKTCLN